MTLVQNGGVTTFFKAYERAIQTEDPDQFGRLYHESFLFGGVQGTRTLQLVEFLRFLPQRAEFAKKLGLTSTRLMTVEALAMDEKYILAKVAWKFKVQRMLGTSEIMTEASYILMKWNEDFRIVVQLDHHDLMERLKTLQN